MYNIVICKCIAFFQILKPTCEYILYNVTYNISLIAILNIIYNLYAANNNFVPDHCGRIVYKCHAHCHSRATLKIIYGTIFKACLPIWMKYEKRSVEVPKITHKSSVIYFTDCELPTLLGWRQMFYWCLKFELLCSVQAGLKLRRSFIQQMADPVSINFTKPACIIRRLIQLKTIICTFIKTNNFYHITLIRNRETWESFVVLRLSTNICLDFGLMTTIHFPFRDIVMLHLIQTCKILGKNMIIIQLTVTKPLIT